MSDIELLIEDYLTYLSETYSDFDKNKDIINKACKVAKIAHEWQFRKYSGKPYIVHPLRVSRMMAKKTKDLSLILAAILHDTVEDAPDKVSMSYIYKTFWDEVWYLVDSVTNNIMYFYNEPDVKFKDKLDKLLTGGMRDARCLVLKMLDREHNNKTLVWLKTDKQIRKSFETQALYVPLRKILKFDDEKFDINNVSSLLSTYQKEHNISSVSELKSSLYQITFRDIDSENFELFYYSSDSIVWEIEDKGLLEYLMSNDNFDDSIEVVSISQDASWKFRCLFKYRKWQIFDWWFKANISSFIK